MKRLPFPGDGREAVPVGPAARATTRCGMSSRAIYAEYLAEIRERVCGPCPQRVSGQPPLRPQCRRCGVELQLARLVTAIREAGDALSELDPAPDRRLVCAHCVCQGRADCPCPAGLVPARLVRAVKAVEERRRQRGVVLRWLARQPHRQPAPIAELIEAYEAATGTCVGCD